MNTRFSSMRALLWLPAIAFLTGISYGCDAVQSAQGYVLDAVSHAPIQGVAIGKEEHEDPGRPYTHRDHTDSSGHFNIHRIGGSSAVTLWFSKEGYRSISRYYPKASFHPDTVFLERQP